MHFPRRPAVSCSFGFSERQRPNRLTSARALVIFAVHAAHRFELAIGRAERPGQPTLPHQQARCVRIIRLELSRPDLEFFSLWRGKSLIVRGGGLAGAQGDGGKGDCDELVHGGELGRECCSEVNGGSGDGRKFQACTMNLVPSCLAPPGIWTAWTSP